MATKEEVEATLERARRTIAESKALLEAVELRRQETDRLLASQGITREQLKAMTFTDEQVELVNGELARRGLPPVDRDAIAETAALQDQIDEERARIVDDGGAKGEDAVENRRRKLGSMMQEIRL